MKWRHRRGTALAAMAVLLIALGAAVAHQASALPPSAGPGEPIADTGHAERGGSAHLDPLVLEPRDECVVCWLGHVRSTLVERAVPAPQAARSGLYPPASPDRPADLGGAASARAPPLG